MVSSQLHYTKVNRFMPFLLAEILNFQGSIHRIGVGSFSKLAGKCAASITSNTLLGRLESANVSIDIN